ncbi:MAG TPA: FAD-dependent oxidoreductase, partial [Lentzea sp.]
MHPDVVVVGAGIIGAACAQALTARGLDVVVLDRCGPASGTSAAGEGNVLVSDKEPGPELELAVASRELWPSLAADAEWEEKGGLVVATTPDAAEPLRAFAAKQRAAGIDACELTTSE